MKRLTINMSDDQHKALCRVAGLLTEDVATTITMLIEKQAESLGVLPDSTSVRTEAIDFEAWPE